MPTEIEWPHNLPYTVSMCAECMKDCGIPYDTPTKIGGSLSGECQICGNERHLHELRTGVTAERIRADFC